MSVSPRQLFGGNIDSSPYIHNDSMMVFNSLDAAEDVRVVPDQSRQQKVHYDCYFNSQKQTPAQGDDNSSYVKTDDAQRLGLTAIAKTTVYSHHTNASDNFSSRQTNLHFASDIHVKNSNCIVNDEAQTNHDLSEVSHPAQTYTCKLDDKYEDTHESSDDAQDTMKNSNDYSLSIEAKSVVSSEEAIQRLISNIIDKSGIQDTADLAQRKDVVNKTILRIVRRFYIQAFKDMFAKKFRSKEAKSKWYYEHIKKFAAEVFGSANPDLHILQTYLASIINPKHMTSQDIKDTGLDADKFFTFHNCLYKYSHTRLVNLFEIKPLASLYNYFYNHSSMTEMLRSEPSVNKNYQIYVSAVRDFSRIFNAMGDTLSLSFN